MIPQHLQPYIQEAIRSGYRDPKAILEFALLQSNTVLQELFTGKTRRAQVVREELCLSTWAKGGES